MYHINKELKLYEDHLILKNYSLQTRKSYSSTLRRFLEYRDNLQSEGSINIAEVKTFLVKRIKSGKSWSTINGDYSALLLYCRDLLGLSWNLKDLPRPRKEKKLPRILSQQDVAKLINSSKSYKHQVFLSFLYATGCRRNEALNVLLSDIDGARMQVRINQGKGKRDRFIQIPPCLIDLLRDYYRRIRPEHYLFNGWKKGIPLSASAARWGIKKALARANISKKVSLHTLRHCYLPAVLWY